MRKSLSLTLCLFVFHLLPMFPGSALSYQDLAECLRDKVLTSADTATVADLKKHCEDEIAPRTSQEAEDPVETRIRQEEQNKRNPFALMAHRPNYVLIGAYNSEGYSATTHNSVYEESIDFDDIETQFQLSLKFPVFVSIFGSNTDIYAAYTNRSFWQVYHTNSSPFRETNHEPEMWLQFLPEWEFFGFKNVVNSIGFNHQSNGQSDELSRSWNRLFGLISFERENLVFSIKPWMQIFKKSSEDDNPNITEYMGHFELLGSYKMRDHVFSFMSRNNLESGFDRGAVELSWSFPLGNYEFLKGYIQWFYGYGESLIDYDQQVNKIGLGLLITDWL